MKKFIVIDNGEKLISVDTRKEANDFINSCKKEDRQERDFSHKYSILGMA